MTPGSCSARLDTEWNHLPTRHKSTLRMLMPLSWRHFYPQVSCNSDVSLIHWGVSGRENLRVAVDHATRSRNQQSCPRPWTMKRHPTAAAKTLNPFSNRSPLYTSPSPSSSNERKYTGKRQETKHSRGCVDQAWNESGNTDIKHDVDEDEHQSIGGTHEAMHQVTG